MKEKSKTILKKFLVKLEKVKIARIISDVFIPPTFAIFISFYLSINFSSNFNQFIVNFLLVYISTVFIPVIYFSYKTGKGEIINRDAVIKEQRNNIYHFSLIVFTIGYILSVLLNAHILVQIFLLNYTLSVFGVSIINKKFKISIHSLTAAGTGAFLIFINPFFSILVLIITILIMWSRIRLGVHTLAEVISGMIYGFSLTLIITAMVLSYAT